MRWKDLRWSLGAGIAAFLLLAYVFGTGTCT